MGLFHVTCKLFVAFFLHYHPQIRYKKFSSYIKLFFHAFFTSFFYVFRFFHFIFQYAMKKLVLVDICLMSCDVLSFVLAFILSEFKPLSLPTGNYKRAVFVLCRRIIPSVRSWFAPATVPNFYRTLPWSDAGRQRPVGQGQTLEAVLKEV